MRLFSDAKTAHLFLLPKTAHLFFWSLRKTLHVLRPSRWTQKRCIKFAKIKRCARKMRSFRSEKKMRRFRVAKTAHLFIFWRPNFRKILVWKRCAVFGISNLAHLFGGKKRCAVFGTPFFIFCEKDAPFSVDVRKKDAPFSQGQNGASFIFQKMR